MIAYAIDKLQLKRRFEIYLLPQGEADEQIQMIGYIFIVLA
jgi:hypothetical protein